MITLFYGKGKCLEYRELRVSPTFHLSFLKRVIAAIDPMECIS
jgi:hypothetical protein